MLPARSCRRPRLCTATIDGVSEDEYVDMLLDHGMGGLVVVSGANADTLADHSLYKRLVGLRLPMVFLNGAVAGVAAPVVSADDGDAAADFAADVAFGYGVRRVIGAFCVNVGTDVADKMLDRRFVKDGDKIHTRQRRNDLGAFFLIDIWTVFAFQKPGLPIRVDAHNENIAYLFRSGEISNVSDMKKVKASVCQNDRRAGLAGFGYGIDEFGERYHWSEIVSHNN